MTSKACETCKGDRWVPGATTEYGIGWLACPDCNADGAIPLKHRRTPEQDREVNRMITLAWTRKTPTPTLLARMTHECPTQPGDYWYKRPDEDFCRPIHVKAEGGQLWACDFDGTAGMEVGATGWQWAAMGPEDVEYGQMVRGS